jgi:Domain of unknown function (DUF397)
VTAPVWRTATASGGGNCVQAASRGSAVLVRDSADPSPDAPHLTLTRAGFAALLTAIKEMPDA